MILLSPAKSLNESALAHELKSFPALKIKQQKLLKILAAKSASELKSLFKVSDKLAELNHERFQQAKSAKSDSGKTAIKLFKGDVYQGLQVEDWLPQDYEKAQERLRILSGFYGILRPMDLIQPYRLEMGTSLAVGSDKNLYEFWDEDITQEINKAAENSPLPFIINLASNEYFKAVKKKLLKKPLLTIQFKEWRDDKLKVISFSAKKARGMMARYLIKEDITTLDGIKAFNLDSYVFDAERSDDKTLLFTR